MNFSRYTKESIKRFIKGVIEMNIFLCKFSQNPAFTDINTLTTHVDLNSGILLNQLDNQFPPSLLPTYQIKTYKTKYLH